MQKELLRRRELVFVNTVRPNTSSIHNRTNSDSNNEKTNDESLINENSNEHRENISSLLTDTSGQSPEQKINSNNKDKEIKKTDLDINSSTDNKIATESTSIMITSNSISSSLQDPKPSTNLFSKLVSFKKILTSEEKEKN